MKIEITFTPRDGMHGPAGSWAWKGETLKVSVADNGTASSDHLSLIAIHEMIEALLCRKRGIGHHQVNQFDANWRGEDHEEPGDHPEAPYLREHRFAMMIEHLVAHEMGLTPYGTVR